MAMRILGVDYGTKRTGLAVGDDEVRVAVPFDVVHARNLADLVAAVAAVAEREGIGRIVLGLPLNMDDTAGPMVETVQALAQRLRDRTGLPVDVFDERLTSEEAESRLADRELTSAKRKRRVDALAAMILLQAYLDRGR